MIFSVRKNSWEFLDRLQKPWLLCNTWHLNYHWILSIIAFYLNWCEYRYMYIYITMVNGINMLLLQHKNHHLYIFWIIWDKHRRRWRTIRTKRQQRRKRRSNNGNHSWENQKRRLETTQQWWDFTTRSTTHWYCRWYCCQVRINIYITFYITRITFLQCSSGLSCSKAD